VSRAFGGRRWVRGKVSDVPGKKRKNRNEELWGNVKRQKSGLKIAGTLNWRSSERGRRPQGCKLGSEKTEKRVYKRTTEKKKRW